MPTFTRDQIMDSVKGMSSRSEWMKSCWKMWKWCYDHDRDLLAEIYGILPPAPGPQSSYTDDELIADARKYKDRQEWIKAGKAAKLEGKASPHTVAIKRGPDFFDRCTAHMVRAPKTQPTRRRSRGLRETACARVVPAESPYAGDYYIYAFELVDRHTYVGLSFREARRQEHLESGPVHDRLSYLLLDQMVNPRADRWLQQADLYVFKKVQVGIADPKEARQAEAAWLAKYRADGWVMLNHAPAGSLGAVGVKWTVPTMVEEAQKYRTKMDLRAANQYIWNQLRVLGWPAGSYEHMVRPAAWNNGEATPLEVRAKLSVAKKGNVLSDETKKKIGDSVRTHHLVKIFGNPDDLKKDMKEFVRESEALITATATGVDAEDDIAIWDAVLSDGLEPPDDPKPDMDEFVREAAGAAETSR